MVGLALVDTTASLQFSARSAASLTAVSTPGGTRVMAEAATEISLSAALSRSVTTLDPATLGAVIGTANGFATGGDAQERSLVLNQLLDGLADTLSKGQGGYFISYHGAQGGGMAASVTPDEFAAIMEGKDDGSFNGGSLGAVVRSALTDVTKQAYATSLQQHAAAIGDSKAFDEQTALALITHDQASETSQTKAKGDVATNGADQIRLLISKQPAPDGVGTATVTIAYIPPSETSVTSESATETSQSVAMLDVTA